MFIEFYKSHKVDDQKVQKIKLLNISCIEININHIEPLVDGKLNTEELRHFFENDSSYKTWIHNTIEEALFSKVKEKLLKEEKGKKRLQEIEISNRKKAEEQKAAEQAEYKARIAEWKQGLLAKGYEFLKVYEYVHWDYEEYTNENRGYTKTYKRFISKVENVYCPKQKEHEKNNRIEINECSNCDYYNTTIYDERYKKKIACGFRKKLTN